MVRISSVLVAVALSLAVTGAWAQNGPPSEGINGPTVPQGTTRDYVSPEDVKSLADLVDTKRQLEGRNLVSARIARESSLLMLKALHVSCEVRDAKSIGAGTRVVNGKAVDIGLYEASCADGMGYLLTMQGELASGVSCFEAGAATTAQAGQSGGAGPGCELPADADLGTMATSVMRNAGTACAARQVRWLGHSAAPNFDFTDVACGGGEEYVLQTPAPGTQGSIIVLTCQAAATHGAACQLAPGSSRAASAGAAPARAASGAQAHPDLQWFEKALAQNGFACTVKNARLLGRESIKRRWVVEFQCAQDPHGVVAYIPSAGDTVHPLEHIDCATAAQRHLACAFPHSN